MPYSRVEKDLGVFRALCKLILSFFQTAVTEINDEVGYNGKAAKKMFAEMIRCSLRDDDFVSRKCTTFNVAHFFKYRIRFLLIVRFVNDFLFIFFSFSCYRRLYVGYWPTFERRDEADNIGCDSPRIRPGK